MIELIGKTTIHPVLFYSGKIAGYLTWASGLYKAIFRKKQRFFLTDMAAGIFFAIGSVFTIVSLINLGASVRLGLPRRNTAFKKSGVYALSRNPMYVGFNLFTVSGMLVLRNRLSFLWGLFSIFVYHLIITGEERFLEERFGDEYREYRRKVRRYI